MNGQLLDKIYIVVFYTPLYYPNIPSWLAVNAYVHVLYYYCSYAASERWLAGLQYDHGWILWSRDEVGQINVLQGNKIFNSTTTMQISSNAASAKSLTRVVHKIKRAWACINIGQYTHNTRAQQQLSLNMIDERAYVDVFVCAYMLAAHLQLCWGRDWQLAPRYLQLYPYSRYLFGCVESSPVILSRGTAVEALVGPW